MSDVTFNPFGETARFHHVGLVVGSIAKVNPQAKIWVDNTQLVKAAFVLFQGLRVELVEPIGDKSPVTRVLKANQKLLHICYEVENIEQAILFCEKYDFYCFGKPVPAVGFGNRKIAWVIHKEYGVFELLET